MRVGVCSWSLQPESPASLAGAVRHCGLTAVQLALDPILTGQWPLTETVRVLGDSGIAILSAMLQTQGEDYTTLETIKQTGGLRLDGYWLANLDTARRAAPLLRELGLSLVTFHAGFLPHDPADALRRTMMSRIRAIHDVFAEAAIDVALETGQESAGTLRELLEELALPHLGVNFDPANMILYGMGDPVEALATLAPWVKQIHLKDAVASEAPGQWGAEVPIGTGRVDWPAFFGSVRENAVAVDFCIEREAGESRIADVRAGHEYLRSIGAIA